MREDPLRRAQRWVSVGLVAMATGVAPGTAFGDERWAEGRQFGLHEATAEHQATAPADQSLVASAMPGSVTVAQAGGAGAETPADAWQFSLAPYLWASRTKMALDVGRLSQSQTIDFVDILPQLHFVVAARFEARWREWTGFLDLFYMSVGQSETQNAVSVSANLQLMLFEFGGTYRLGSVSLGRAGRLTFEPLAGGRFIWVDASLGFPDQKVSESASLIDPMVGGRIAYHITDTVALWFRGDVAGFGISDNQTQLTYNLIAGLEWRFWHRASALAGWRYLDIDLEKGSGARTLDLDIRMSGPFLGLNFHF